VKIGHPSTSASRSLLALTTITLVLIASVSCTREAGIAPVEPASTVDVDSPSQESTPAPPEPPKVEAMVELKRRTYILNVRTGEAVTLPGSITSIPRAGNYDVSPDGSMILFDNAERFAPSDERAEIGFHQLYVADIDGSDVRRLTHDPLGASQGSWSPDGTKVVYIGGWARICCWRSPAKLMVVDVSTGSTTRLATGRAKAFQDPFFGPDGSEILFTRPDPSRNYVQDQPQADLWAIPLDGGDPELLLEDRGYASYSPDGSKIAFPRFVFSSEGNSGGTYAESWISDADGSFARRWARGWPGQWSPDGKRIFYDQGRLRLVSLVTGRSQLLTAGTGYDWLDNETLIVVSR